MLENALDNNTNKYFQVTNGYTFSDIPSLERLSTRLQSCSEKDELRDLIKIGLHEDTEVTFASRFVPPSARAATEGNHNIVTVTQAYCSALSCTYSGIDNRHWQSFARLVLEANYEATLWAAVARSREAQVGSSDVYLTLLGGGVFGNELHWIGDAIGRALGY